MKLHLENTGQKRIEHYGVSSLTIDGHTYRQSVLLLSDRVVAPWFDGPLESLTLADFSPLLDLPAEARPEIVLLGTGTQHCFPPLSLLADVKTEGMALEVMNTRAACRTYSVLIGEYRTVAAGLLPIES